MKKIIALIICTLILVALTSCGSDLPKGKASRIDFVDGNTYDESDSGELTFEYINENTVKIVRASDGQVFYVPNTNIEKIWVE